MVKDGTMNHQIIIWEKNINKGDNHAKTLWNEKKR
jgi:hypothetical protein